jgi:aryl-alcohol dehydrogenase-like predicted oxidoreductase
MVSELCLGTMTFGRETGAGEATGLVERFLAAGGTFFDTADVYGRGTSEQILGGALSDAKVARESVVLATKVYGPMSEAAESGAADRNNLGLSRKHVIAACDASLRRLGTDYIDLYQVHLWDAATPVAETLAALTDLVRGGKVHYIGCSNYSAWQLMKALGVSDVRRLEHFVSVQPQYSLVERNIERELLPACLAEGVGVLPWSPLGGGFLSGKYRRGEAPPEGTRIAGAPETADEAWQRRASESNWRILTVVEAICGETGKSPAQVALNWLLQQPGVTTPILGVRTLEQLEDNLGAAGWRLDSEQVRRLSEAGEPEDVYPQRVIRQVTDQYARA